MGFWADWRQRRKQNQNNRKIEKLRKKLEKLQKEYTQKVDFNEIAKAKVYEKLIQSTENEIAELQSNSYALNSGSNLNKITSGN